MLLREQVVFYIIPIILEGRYQILDIIYDCLRFCFHRRERNLGGRFCRFLPTGLWCFNPKEGHDESFLLESKRHIKHTPSCDRIGPVANGGSSRCGELSHLILPEKLSHLSYMP